MPVVRGTMVVIVMFFVTGSRQPPNQPHLRQVDVGNVIVAVASAFPVPVVVVRGIVVVMVVFDVMGSTHPPNQPYLAQVVMVVVIVSVVSAEEAEVVVVSS